MRPPDWWLAPFSARRPGERRDPYTGSSRFDRAPDTFSYNQRQGLGGPAFRRDGGNQLSPATSGRYSDRCVRSALSAALRLGDEYDGRSLFNIAAQQTSVPI